MPIVAGRYGLMGTTKASGKPTMRAIDPQTQVLKIFFSKYPAAVGF